MWFFTIGWDLLRLVVAAVLDEWCSALDGAVARCRGRRAMHSGFDARVLALSIPCLLAESLWRLCPRGLLIVHTGVGDVERTKGCGCGGA